MQGMHGCVSPWMRSCMCVYVDCGLCFSFAGDSVHLFVFQVLSLSCVGMVWWCTAGRKWSNKRSQSLLCMPIFIFDLLSLQFHFSLYSNLKQQSVFISPCFSFSSPNLSVFSASRSLPVLYRKHFQRWHTREDSHPENRTTTTMTMLSSHNNTRITYWERKLFWGQLCRPGWPAWPVAHKNCCYWSVKHGDNTHCVHLVCVGNILSPLCWYKTAFLSEESLKITGARPAQ